MISPEYIAGFFDGEGCVGFTITGQAKMLAVRVSIVNTNLEFLKVIQSQYGGKIYSKDFINKPTWKTFNNLVWANYHAIEFLIKIERFIFIKQAQIKLAKEYWEFSQTSNVDRCDRIEYITKAGLRRVKTKRSAWTL